MSKQIEFLTKLRNLLEEYDTRITFLPIDLDACNITICIDREDVYEDISYEITVDDIDNYIKH